MLRPRQFSGYKACVAQTGKLRLTRALDCQLHVGTQSLPQKWEEGFSMPTGGHSRENGSARQAQGQVTGRTSGHMSLAAHVPMPLPQLSTPEPPTWERPILGQLGLQSTQETSGVPWYSLSPPAIICVLGKPFPPNHQTLPRLAATALPTISHHRKPQGPNPALPTEVLLPCTLPHSC